MLPLFLDLARRRVVLVGGGRVAAAKLPSLVAAGADLRVVALAVHADIERAGVRIERRGFVPADLDEAWLVVAAATPEVNREVAEAANARRIFVNAVDDPANATAFLSGVIRRDGVTIAISTSGDAPALTALLREALDAVLPRDLSRWLAEARRQRAAWRRDGVAMEKRRPLLLEALNALYSKATAEHAEHTEISFFSAASDRSPEGLRHSSTDVARGLSPAADVARDFSPAIPWLSGPEDSKR